MRHQRLFFVVVIVAIVAALAVLFAIGAFEGDESPDTNGTVPSLATMESRF